MLRDIHVDRIDLLKLDVLGHEEKVLLGMSDILGRKGVDLLIVEAHPVGQVSATRITSLMKSYGYQLAMERDYLFGQTHLYFTANGNEVDYPKANSTAFTG